MFWTSYFPSSDQDGQNCLVTSEQLTRSHKEWPSMYFFFPDCAFGGENHLEKSCVKKNSSTTRRTSLARCIHAKLRVAFWHIHEGLLSGHGAHTHHQWPSQASNNLRRPPRLLKTSPSLLVQWIQPFRDGCLRAWPRLDIAQKLIQIGLHGELERIFEPNITNVRGSLRRQGREREGNGGVLVLHPLHARWPFHRGVEIVEDLVDGLAHLGSQLVRYRCKDTPGLAKHMFHVLVECVQVEPVQGFGHDHQVHRALRANDPSKLLLRERRRSERVRDVGASRRMLELLRCHICRDDLLEILRDLLARFRKRVSVRVILWASSTWFITGLSWEGTFPWDQGFQEHFCTSDRGDFWA